MMRAPEDRVNVLQEAACEQQVPLGVLTKQLVAARYQVSVRTVENWMSDGLPFRNPTGRCVRFDLAEIEHWMATKTKAVHQVRVRAKRKVEGWPRSGNGSKHRMTLFPNSSNIVEDRRLLKYFCGMRGESLAE